MHFKIVDACIRAVELCFEHCKKPSVVLSRLFTCALYDFDTHLIGSEPITR